MSGSVPLLGKIGIGAQALGGLVGAFGAEQTATATSQADLINAAVLRNNAALSLRAGQYEAEAGGAKVQQQELKGRAQIGAIKAAQAASNLDVNSGSAPQVRTGQQMLNQLDAMTISSDTARKYYGYQVQAAGETEQAGLEQTAAEKAREQGLIGGLTSILGGASGAGTSYAQWLKTGGPVNGSTGADIGGTGANATVSNAPFNPQPNAILD